MVIKLVYVGSTLTKDKYDSIDKGVLATVYIPRVDGPSKEIEAVIDKPKWLKGR